MNRNLSLTRCAVFGLLVGLTFAASPGNCAESAKRDEQVRLPTERRDELLAKAAVAPLGSRESFDLCVAQFKLGRIPEALTVAQLALGSTKDPRERAAFMGVIAQCRGAFGDITNAANAALEGQRLNPDSRELAQLRFAYFSKIGDLAQREAASDCLAYTDPNRATPVFSVNDGVLIITIGAQVIKVLADAYQVWYEEKLKGGDDPHKWWDRPEVKVAARVLEKLWELGPIIGPTIPRVPISPK